MEVRIGTVTNYFERIGVAVIELEDTLHVGDFLHFSGHGANFEQAVASMQIEHQPVTKAGAGQSVGLKTDAHVRRGTLVYRKS